MTQVQNINPECAGFSGGASGFGDKEFVELLQTESLVAGTGLSVGALQSVARRQLIGSVVVAAGIAIVAGLTALRPMYMETASAPSHRFAVVQQPSFETPTSSRIAAIKQNNIEVP